jgi:hypothetical protein
MSHLIIYPYIFFCAKWSIQYSTVLTAYHPYNLIGRFFKAIAEIKLQPLLESTTLRTVWTENPPTSNGASCWIERTYFSLLNEIYFINVNMSKLRQKKIGAECDSENVKEKNLPLCHRDNHRDHIMYHIESSLFALRSARPVSYRIWSQ